jgi:hypothetical protein
VKLCPLAAASALVPSAGAIDDLDKNGLVVPPSSKEMVDGSKSSIIWRGVDLELAMERMRGAQTWRQTTWREDHDGIADNLDQSATVLYNNKHSGKAQLEDSSQRMRRVEMSSFSSVDVD